MFHNAVNIPSIHSILFQLQNINAHERGARGHTNTHNNVDIFIRRMLVVARMAIYSIHACNYSFLKS